MKLNKFPVIMSGWFKLFIIVFITLVYSGISYSQSYDKSGKTPEEKATKMADRMKQNLSLSDDQYKQIYNLALEKAKTHASNKEKNRTLDKETRKSMRMQNNAEYRKQLEGILNQDQITKMKSLKNKHHGNKTGHKGKKNKNRDQVN